MKKQIDILLVAYNQEKYIRQALDGIFIQRLENDIKMRIIVADDCSTDGTLDIIKKYSFKHSADWLFLPSSQNLGIAKNYKRAIAATTADYVAILEGDDYWIDANRLQKHIDYLSAHTDCVMTVNDYMEYSQEYAEWKWSPVNRRYLLLREMIANYCLANLSARVYRGDVLRKVGEKTFEYGERQRNEATDYYMTMDVLRYGYGYVLDEVMSVYRVDTGANLSKREMSYDEELARARLCKSQMLEMMGETYKNECNEIYHEAVRWTNKVRMADRENRWANYIPPFISKLIWQHCPLLWYAIKHSIRQCIPHKLHIKRH
ncbi:MAG: glycosyltransferase [Paludibacteraceae bacterium]|nr:glycosyltransferase [Paludibacteraceae bacterium]